MIRSPAVSRPNFLPACLILALGGLGVPMMSRADIILAPLPPYVPTYHSPFFQEPPLPSFIFTVPTSATRGERVTVMTDDPTWGTIGLLDTQFTATPGASWHELTLVSEAQPFPDFVGVGFDFTAAPGPYDLFVQTTGRAAMLYHLTLPADATSVSVVATDGDIMSSVRLVTPGLTSFGDLRIFAAPEPASWGMLATAGVAMASVARRRRR